MDDQHHTCTAFEGNRRAASGRHAQVALAIKALLGQQPDAGVLIFDDATGQQIDFDLRGSDLEITARLGAGETKPDSAGVVRGPGRPRLGVVAREITLLPRHWEWLATQSGGASVTLRKLVEAARRVNSGKDRERLAQARAYSFMSAMAGNLVGFEEAARALFANDQPRFSELVAKWPMDLRDYAIQMAFEADAPSPPGG